MFSSHVRENGEEAQIGSQVFFLPGAGNLENVSSNDYFVFRVATGGCRLNGE